MLVSPAGQARKEIRDMIDATLSVIVREHAVDESFVISEIKNYLSETNAACPRNNDLKVIQYTRKQQLGGGNLGTVLNALRSKVQRISSIRFASCPPKGSN